MKTNNSSLSFLNNRIEKLEKKINSATPEKKEEIQQVLKKYKEKKIKNKKIDNE